VDKSHTQVTHTYTHTKEAVNYIHADPRLREAKEVEPLLRQLHLRCKAATLKARVRVLHSAT
jgi:hypothetical protein